jgi:hypothetical protein
VDVIEFARPGPFMTPIVVVAMVLVVVAAADFAFRRR